jgi:flagellar protein FliO/FliZ
MAPGWMSLVWFALIVALIPLCLWVLKRSGRVGGLAAATPGAMRVVQSIGLGQHQRVVMLEVGQGAERRWLVLGVTAQQINTLHTLEQPPELDAPAPLPLPTWLARWQPPVSSASSVSSASPSAAAAASGVRDGR